MNKSAEVIIIGGGAVGCAAAYYLSKRGTKVIVLEAAESIGHGASSRNAGGVRQSGRDSRELPYAMYGIKNLWPTLSEELGVDVEYCQTGNLRIGLNEEEINILKNRTRSANALGLEVSMIDAKTVHNICPYLTDRVVGASWCPSDGHANPLRTTLAFYRKAKELGTLFVTNASIVQIQKQKGKIRRAVTEDGTMYEADTIILAAGYGSRAIARTVDVDIPMTREFEECLVTELEPKMFDMMLGVATGEVYGHQTSHGSFVFGADSGFEPYNDNYKSLHTNPLNASAISRTVLKYVPSLQHAKVIRTWGGWLDMCYDNVPMISKVKEVPGLILACGFTGHGFGTAPAVGLLLSQLTYNEKTFCSIDDLRYDRFKSEL
jgi:sarcosine oxidase, subunit beta